MPLSVIVLAVLGLGGILGGIYAAFATATFSNKGPAPRKWKVIRARLFVIGIPAGLATWPLTYWMGYRVETADGVYRIVGIPFMVACFDSAGRDYVGPLTMPGVIANIVFWSLLPQVFLLFWGRIWRKQATERA